jgi:hypothetical protein
MRVISMSFINFNIAFLLHSFSEMVQWCTQEIKRHLPSLHVDYFTLTLRKKISSENLFIFAISLYCNSYCYSYHSLLLLSHYYPSLTSSLLLFEEVGVCAVCIVARCILRVCVLWRLAGCVFVR